MHGPVVHITGVRSFGSGWTQGTWNHSQSACTPVKLAGQGCVKCEKGYGSSDSNRFVCASDGSCAQE